MRILFTMLMLTLFSFNCPLISFHPQPQLLELDMVFIPGGTYSMGDFYEHQDQDALPVHTVTLPDFSLAKYEVPYAQYDRFAML